MLQRFAEIDIFGHKPGLNYRGQETHNTLLGAFFTLIVYVLTIVIMVQKVAEIFLMQDPSI